jgi:hypothetical protein
MISKTQLSKDFVLITKPKAYKMTTVKKGDNEKQSI